MAGAFRHGHYLPWIEGLALLRVGGWGRLDLVEARVARSVVDRSPTMLTHAPDPVVRAEATTLPFADASFGSVALLYVLYHLADPGPAIAEAHRVLRPRRPAGRRRAQPPRRARTRPRPRAQPADVRR